MHNWICTGKGAYSTWAHAQVDMYRNRGLHYLEQFTAVHYLHCKKVLIPFQTPSWDVTDQTLPSRKYVSLTKPEVFPNIPFPHPEIFTESF